MQSDVGVTAVEAGKQGREQPHESNERILPEGAKKQIEPDDIRVMTSHSGK